MISLFEYKTLRDDFINPASERRQPLPADFDFAECAPLFDLLLFVWFVGLLVCWFGLVV